MRRASCSPAIHSATTPSLMSGAGYSAMSVMLTPARPSSSASCAITPGRFGTDARSSNSGPPASCASSSRRRSSAAPSFQLVDPRHVGGGERVADRGQARDRVVDPRRQRVAVGDVYVGPDRARRAGDAGRVAEARTGGGQRSWGGSDRSSVRAAWETSTFASTCGRCETVASIVSWVSVDRGRTGAEPGAGGAAARTGSRRGRGRRQVPGGAVEQVRARMPDAEVSAPASGWPPTNRAALDRGDDRALGRADVGDHAILRRGGERGRGRLREGPRPGTATNTASASLTASATSSAGARRSRRARRAASSASPLES